MTKNTKISLELDEELNKRLKQYCLDHFPIAHGKQQQVIREALTCFLDGEEEDEEEEREKQIEDVMIRSEIAIENVKGTRLTDAEKALIKEERRSGKGWTEISNLLVGRSASTVRSAAVRMVEKGEMSKEFI